MSSSILTNPGAMTAVRVLGDVGKNLQTTNDRISTGLKVQNAKDNASFWSVSTTMKSDVNAFKAIGENLSLANNSTSVARDGAQQITKLVDEIKSKVTAAQEGSIDKTKIQADIDASIDQIGEIIKSAQFNGVNLLNSDETVNLVSSIARDGGSVTASSISFAAENMSLEDGGLKSLLGLDVTDRGSSIVENATDGNNVAVFDATNGGGTALTFSGTEQFELSYLDEKGSAQELSVDVGSIAAPETEDGVGLLADRLNADESFNSKFKATGNGTDLEITAVDRESSSLRATDISDGTDTIGVGDVNRTELSFQDTPLKAGEEFTLNYTVAGADKSVTLRVMSEDSDLNTGDIISSGENDDGAVIALSADDVSDISETGLTGDDIATAFAFALTDTNSAFAGTGQGDDFDAAADEGVSIGVDATSTPGTLSLITEDDTGGVDDVAGTWTLPETDYQSLLNRVESASQTAIDAAAKFGSVQTRLEVQQDFLTSLTDNLESGIGTLVDADMAEESARLQALQVQQQLGTQALSIANSQPQNILSLFG